MYIFISWIFIEISKNWKRKKSANEQECQLPTGYKNSEPSCR